MKQITDDNHRGLILIDLDRTLLNKDYQLTTPDILPNIQNLINQGFCIGISSDSPIDTIRYWADRLLLNGPLVAENGASIEWIGIINKVLSNFKPNKLKSSLLNHLRKLEQNALFLYGDVTAMVRSKTHILIKHTPFPIYMINTMREHSISLYVKKLDADGYLINCEDKLFDLRNIFQELVSSDLVIKADPEYCFFSISQKSINKNLSFHYLRDQFPYLPMYIIGDSLSDYSDCTKVKLFSVGNGSDEYKSKCSFVGNNNYTKGVIDCLKHIKNQRFKESTIKNNTLPRNE